MQAVETLKRWDKSRLSPLEMQMYEALQAICDRMDTFDNGKPFSNPPDSMWARARAALAAADRASRPVEAPCSEEA
jgi:hypothetical protein